MFMFMLVGDREKMARRDYESSYLAMDFSFRDFTNVEEDHNIYIHFTINFERHTSIRDNWKPSTKAVDIIQTILPDLELTGENREHRETFNRQTKEEYGKMNI